MMPVALAVVHPLQDAADPQKHPWARFAPGASVKIRITDQRGGIVEETSTLKRVERTQVVLDHLRVRGERREEFQSTIPLLFHGLAEPRKVAKETLKVAGREFECETYEWSREEDPVKFAGRAWVTPEIHWPIRFRDTCSVEGTETIRAGELVDMEAQLDVGGRKVKCLKFAGKFVTISGEDKSKRSEVDLTQWYSMEVPGGCVRELQGKRIVEVLEFSDGHK